MNIHLLTKRGHGHKYPTAIKCSLLDSCPSTASSCVPHPGDVACHSGLSQLGFLSTLAGLSTCGFLFSFLCPPCGIGSVRLVSAGSSTLAVAKPLSPGQLSLATFRLPFPGFSARSTGRSSETSILPLCPMGS